MNTDEVDFCPIWQLDTFTGLRYTQQITIFWDNTGYGQQIFQYSNMFGNTWFFYPMLVAINKAIHAYFDWVIGNV